MSESQDLAGDGPGSQAARLSDDAEAREAIDSREDRPISDTTPAATPLPQGSPPIENGDSPAIVVRAPFLWPPRPDPRESERAHPTQNAAQTPRPCAPPTPFRTRTSVSIVSAWRAIESAWLDPRVLSFARRARESGWQADDASAYCPRCALSVGPFEADNDGCATCRNARLPWARAIRLGPYEGLLREAIHDLKFSAFRHVGAELGHEIGRRLARARERAGLGNLPMFIVPVPTSTRRRLSRRIDHTLTLARGASRTSGGKVLRALARKHRPEQWAVPPSERARNVSGAFRVRGIIPQSRALIVLLDDVRTSGATLRSASRALGRSWRGLARSERPTLWVAMIASAESRAGPGGPGTNIVIERAVLPAYSGESNPRRVGTIGDSWKEK